MTYFGIDVHKKTSMVAWHNPATGEDGHQRLHTDRVQFAELLEQFPRPWIVAIEATRQSPAACDWLRALGVEIHLTDPQQLSLFAQIKRAKTDLKDAQLLLHALLHEYLPEVYLAPLAVREKRDLYHAHANLRQSATKYRNLLRTCLNKADLDLSACDLLGVYAQAQMEQAFTQMPPLLAATARSYWALLLAVEQQLTLIDQEIKAQVKADPLGDELLKLPGLGPVLAFGLIALIGDISRFGSWSQLCSYAGMTPRSARSDDFAADGHLPQRCHRALRNLVMLAAQAAARSGKYSRAKATYERLKEHKPKNTAKVAAGRELLRDVFFIWQRLTAA
jgi:transposase